MDFVPKRNVQDKVLYRPDTELLKFGGPSGSDAGNEPNFGFKPNLAAGIVSPTGYGMVSTCPTRILLGSLMDPRLASYISFHRDWSPL